MVTLPRPALALVALAITALSLLFLGALGSQFLLAYLADQAATSLPELAYLQVPLLALGITFCLCVQLGIVAVGALIVFTRTGRILRASSLYWVDALTALLGIGAALLAAIWAVLVGLAEAGPPGLLLLLLAAILVLLAVLCVTLVLRSLLRGTIALRAELDEVV